MRRPFLIWNEWYLHQGNVCCTFVCVRVWVIGGTARFHCSVYAKIYCTRIEVTSSNTTNRVELDHCLVRMTHRNLCWKCDIHRSSLGNIIHRNINRHLSTIGMLKNTLALYHMRSYYKGSDEYNPIQLVPCLAVDSGRFHNTVGCGGLSILWVILFSSKPELRESLGLQVHVSIK